MRSQKIELVILGATSYSEIFDLIKDINNVNYKYEVIALLDDNEKLHGKKIEGINIKGCLKLANDFSKNTKFVLGIGSHKTRIIRYHILKRLGIPDSRFETLIHPTASIHSKVKIGNGCIIHTGSVIFHSTLLDSFVVLVANSVIGTRNLIGRGALITSLVSTTADVKIGSFSFIGTGSLIAEGIEIGPGSMIGMGSLIHKNIKHGSVAFGNPFRIIRREKIPKEIVSEWDILKNYNIGVKLWIRLK